MKDRREVIVDDLTATVLRRVAEAPEDENEIARIAKVDVEAFADFMKEMGLLDDPDARALLKAASVWSGEPRKERKTDCGDGKRRTIKAPKQPIPFSSRGRRVRQTVPIGQKSPRVHISYSLEHEDLQERAELPFVVAVLAKLTQKPGLNKMGDVVRLGKRKFVEIRRDNFDSVLSNMNVRFSGVVRNRLTEDEKGELAVDLQLSRLQDFSPGQIARQVEELRRLSDARYALKALYARIVCGQTNTSQLLKILQDTGHIANRNSFLRDKRESDVKSEKKSDREEERVPDDKETREIGKGPSPFSGPLNNRKKPSGKSEFDDDKSLLEKIVAVGWGAVDVVDKALAESGVEQLIRHIVDEHVCSLDDTTIEKLLAKIDRTLSVQIDEIIHQSDFKALESAWRGLHYLVSQSEVDNTLKIRVMNVAKEELLDDLTEATSLIDSEFYRLVCGGGDPTLDSEPFGVIIGDYDFSSQTQDVVLLKRLAKVAGVAYAPFVAGASPKLFGWDTYSENLPSASALDRQFQGHEHAEWRSFRDSADANFVGLCVPRILLRLPYGDDTNQVDEFRYEEYIGTRDRGHYLWGNSAFAFGTCLTRAFSTYGWCAAIRGAESGGAVERLPVHTATAPDGETVEVGPTESGMTDSQEIQLAKLGLIPLACSRGTWRRACFYSAASVRKPKRYDELWPTYNDELGSKLPYVFIMSHIAHYLRIIYQRLSSQMTLTRNSLEEYFRQWLWRYVHIADDTSLEMKARYPFREASVEVIDSPGTARSYKAILYLMPHFQLESMIFPIRFVVELGSEKVPE